MTGPTLKDSVAHGAAPASGDGAAHPARGADTQGGGGEPAHKPWSQPPLPQSRWGALRYPHYRSVWSASFFSNVGNWMEMLGVQMIVARETGSMKMLGYFGAAQLVPILLLGVMGGLLADRVNRRTLLVVTQGMLMLIAGALAALSWWQPGEWAWLRGYAGGSGLVAGLFVLSVIQGTVIAFNMPAWQVLTPRLVPREELTKAITLNGIQFNAARVVGPALAGVIMGTLGATPLFVINTITFMGVLAAVSRTPDCPPPPRAQARAWKQVGEALGFIFHHRGPLYVFVAMALMSLLAAPMVRMLPLFVIDAYGIVDKAREDATVGALLSVLGLGAVLGGLALKYIPSWYPRQHFIPLSLCGAGLTVSLFALTSAAWEGYIAMFVCGIFWIWGFNQTWAAMQHLVADTMRGRVMALANVGAFGATAIGNIAAGWIGEYGAAVVESKKIGAQLGVGVLPALLFVAGVAMLIWRSPEVDTWKRVRPRTAESDRAGSSA